MAKDYTAPTATRDKVGIPDPGMDFLWTASYYKAYSKGSLQELCC